MVLGTYAFQIALWVLQITLVAAWYVLLVLCALVYLTYDGGRRLWRYLRLTRAAPRARRVACDAPRASDETLANWPGEPPAPATLEPPARTNDAAQRRTLAGLPPAPRRLLEILLEEHPHELPIRQLAERVGLPTEAPASRDSLDELARRDLACWRSASRLAVSNQLFPFGPDHS